MIEIVKHTGPAADLPFFEVESAFLSDVDLDYWDVYIGYEDGIAVGFFILSKPSEPGNFVRLHMFNAIPHVLYLQNSGTTAVKEALLTKIKEVCIDNGWTSFLATNLSNYPDEAWMDSFSLAGTPTRLGSVFSFQTTE
jgi:hypothetical protein